MTGVAIFNVLFVTVAPPHSFNILRMTSSPLKNISFATPAFYTLSAFLFFLKINSIKWLERLTLASRPWNACVVLLLRQDGIKTAVNDQCPRQLFVRRVDSLTDITDATDQSSPVYQVGYIWEQALIPCPAQHKTGARP